MSPYKLVFQILSQITWKNLTRLLLSSSLATFLNPIRKTVRKLKCGRRIIDQTHEVTVVFFPIIVLNTRNRQFGDLSIF